MAATPNYLGYAARCLEEAGTGLFDKADRLKSTLGVLVVFLVLTFFGQSAFSPKNLLIGVVVEVGALLASLLVVYLVRAVTAPARLAATDHAEIARLEHELAIATTNPLSDLRLTIDGGIAIEFGQKTRSETNCQTRARSSSPSRTSDTRRCEIALFF
ncbi:MAG: hypothetical protein ACRDQZ_20030 [Mycobacteriales bacterium]